MDWLSTSQTVIFGMYVSFLYYTHKSEVGELKNGETLGSIFLTRFFQFGLFLGIASGMLGGVMILFSSRYILRHIDDMDLWVDKEWNTLVYSISVASFIYLIMVYSRINDTKIIRNYKCDIRLNQHSTCETIIYRAKNASMNGIVLIEELEKIIEEEQKLINSNRIYKSPFRKNIFE